MDKSREQFEAAIKQKYDDLIDQRVCKNGDGEYMAWDTQVAWWAWQASRAAVEIEIPEVLDYWLGREGFAESIRDAGVKVKGE
ncbi:hypothetical protein SNN57_003081 [Cronobacter sakazakii]|uniref:hypothetical protein n=1 Tax=Cronobacter sakazakii TaxID=28141 RepID=UPI0015C57B0C|nr:hypothetical protein [Cronobacter sakazakii]EKK4042870.1 hypothetical protein [Cronobacter sakazakii]ELY4577730.1 hypothetical protein [Cronobacter sakazakii]ELY5786962.1 hypothetical protein [Cronobacter sakazakii]ELY6235795.1 hypothetical protein [Cronobacter sakazakii]